MMEQDRVKRTGISRYIFLFGLTACLLLAGFYIYFLYTGTAKQWLASIHQLGFLGIAVGVLIQILANTFPMSGEFISIILIEVYGPVEGGFLSWIGAVLGAALAYLLSHWMARPLIEPVAKPYLEKVNQWLEKHGELGLLLLRLVPFVPYHFVNYAAGILGVNFKAFLWTTAVGVVPFTITVSSLFAGLRYGKVLPFVLGAVLFILSALFSSVVRKKAE